MKGIVIEDYGNFKKGDEVQFYEYNKWLGKLGSYVMVRNLSQGTLEWIEQDKIKWLKDE